MAIRGLYRRSGTPAGRLLFDLIRTSGNVEGSALAPVDSYMELAVYDLVGALFAPSEPLSGSRHADKLFARIRNIIKGGFADPSFGPHEVAAEAWDIATLPSEAFYGAWFDLQ